MKFLLLGILGKCGNNGLNFFNQLHGAQQKKTQIQQQNKKLLSGMLQFFFFAFVQQKKIMSP